MNPLTLYRSLPYIIIVVLVVAHAWTTNLYLGKRDQLAALTASTQALGQAAQKIVEEKKIEHANNLQTVKENYENHVPTIRADAVRNYLAAHHRRVRVERAGGGALPRDAPGEQVDDRASKELVPDSAFIEDAAEDALKLNAWQEWSRLNAIPVED